jgi:hypothetical protein
MCFLEDQKKTKKKKLTPAIIQDKTYPRQDGPLAFRVPDGRDSGSSLDKKKQTESIKKREISASHGCLAGWSETQPIRPDPRPAKAKREEGTESRVDRPVSELVLHVVGR